MRTIKRALLTAALAFCATRCSHAPTYCRTVCGLSLAAPGNCQALQQQETVALNIYADRGLFERTSACSALSGYVISVPSNSDGVGFEDPWKRYVAGETDCEAGTIEVANTRWHSRTNALSHEMIHAIQTCYEVDGDQHYQWAERGYYSAIEAARPDP